jgi:hypothetical protein
MPKTFIFLTGGSLGVSNGESLISPSMMPLPPYNDNSGTFPLMFDSDESDAYDDPPMTLTWFCLSKIPYLGLHSKRNLSFKVPSMSPFASY